MSVSEKAIIAMDRREDSLFADLLRTSGAEVRISTLVVGDFICSDRVVVERKSRADFESSVIDGRLFDQLARLSSSYSRVILIVEGTESSNSLSKSSLLGAYSSVLTDYGAGIFFTRSPKSTAELLYAIAKHEQLMEKRPLRISGKRKGKTLSKNQLAVVEMLPLIGPKMAKILLENFGTITNIATASTEQLLEIDGLGKKKATLIKNVFSRPFESESEDDFTSYRE